MLGLRLARRQLSRKYHPFKPPLAYLCTPPASSSSSKSPETSSTSTISTLSTGHGFLSRTLLVGGSVGLATPLFALGGVAQIWWNYLPRTVAGAMAKHSIFLLIGGGISTLLVNVVVPFLSTHSELVLPFSLANGIAAAGWYALAEGSLGLPTLLGAANPRLTFLGVQYALPVVGASLGLLTAVTAPFLWSPLFGLCWSPDLHQIIFDVNSSSSSSNWISSLYRELFLPVALPVGVLAGSTMHLLLAPFLRLSSSSSSGDGHSKAQWQSRPAILALLIVYGSATAYFLLCRSNQEDVWWEERFDVLGRRRSVNAKTNQVLQDGGKKADEAADYRSLFASVHSTHKLLTWLQSLLFRRSRDYSGAAVPKEEDGTNQKGNDSDLSGRPLSLAALKERRLLFSLIDGLVALKALEIKAKQGADSSSAAESKEERVMREKKIKEVARRLEDKFSLNNAFALLRDCEAAVLQQRRQRSSDSSPTASEPWRRKLEAQQEGVLRSRSTVSSSSQRALDLLVANLPLFERALEMELEYKIEAPSPAAAYVDYSSFSSREDSGSSVSSSVADRVLTAAVGGAVLGVGAYLLTVIVGGGAGPSSSK